MASEAWSVRPATAMSTRRLPLGQLAGAVVLMAGYAVGASGQETVSPTESGRPASASDVSQPDNPSEKRLEYIMVYGPADRRAEWEPKIDDGDHRRVAPGEFRELLRRAHVDHPPSIRSARYEARFVNDELVDGRALLEIDHSGPIETVLPLEPFGLAIGKAGWADRDGEPARLGLGPDGRFELRVDQRGTLDFEWSLKGSPQPLAGADFVLKLPRCPMSQLVLTLPEDRIPMILPLPEDRTSTFPGGILSRKKASAEGMHTWQIDLGVQNLVALRIAPQGDPEGHSQFTELRQDSRYALAPGSLELSVKLRFDVLGQPLRRLELLIPRELNLVAVSDGDTPIRWSEISGQRQAARRVIVDPKLPLHGLGRELTLKALAQIRLDEPWRLPAVTVEGVHWCESVASVTVQHPLRLNDITSRDGRITQVRPQQARRTTDTVDLQLFAPDAGIEVVLGQEQTPPKIDYGVAIEMSAGQIAGRQTVLLETEEGEHLEVVGQVTPSWIVDSIQSDPSGAIADWRIEPADQAKRQLVVELAKPVSTNTPIKLVVSARRLEPTEGIRYSAGDVVPVEFDGGKLGVALVSLFAPEPYQLELSGIETLGQREPQNLTTRERQLLAEPLRGNIYRHDGTDKDLGIMLKRRQSLFSAEIDVSVSVLGRQATEDYVFLVKPQSVRLDSVVVELMKRPGSPLRWDSLSEEEVHLNAQLQPGESSELERWAVRLRPSQTGPFRIRAVRAFPVDDGTAIGLARLPDAADQKGRLSIGTSGAEAVSVENRGLTPEPPDPLLDTGEIARPTYRFDPLHSLGPGTAPVLLRIRDTSPSLPEAWVWLSQLESRLEPTGEARHVASYRIESVGAPLLTLVMPPPIRAEWIDSVEIDGQRIPPESAPTGRPPKIAVRLSPTRRFHEVAVCYRTVGARWAALQPLQIPFPEPDIPVWKRNWILWLPPGRQMLDTKGMASFSGVPRGWPACVWGPMGRDASDGPLDPLALGSPYWSTRPADAVPVSSFRAKVAFPESFPANWGELVGGNMAAVWSEMAAQNGRISLFVDVDAVTEQGISPSTAVTRPEEDGFVDQLASLLDRAGLAVAVSGRYAVITSGRKAAAHGQQMTVHPGIENVWQVTDEARQAEINRAISEGLPSLVDASKWAEVSSPAPMPWNAVERPGFVPRDATGWTVHEIGLQGSEAPEVLVADRNLLQAGLWLCFLIVAFLTWAAAMRYPALSVLSVAFYVIGGAYLPEFWVPWLSAGFWGGVCGVPMRLVTVRRVKGAGRILSTRPLRASTPVIGAITGCIVSLAIAGGAVAQPPEVDNWPDGPALILAPVGADKKPTGEDYFVPELFYLELQRRALRVAEQSPAWLLKGADYRARLNWQTTGGPLTVTELTAEYEIEVIRPNEPVEIAFGDTTKNWTLEGAWLDGRQERPPWESNRNLVVAAEPTRSCRLKLQLTPIPGFGVTRNGFQLTIPPLATSRLELSIPADATRVEVPTSTGRNYFRQGQTKLTVDLGPVDTLAVKWQPTDRASSAKMTRVDEMIWLRLTPGGALVQTQFHYEIGEDFAGEVELIRDSRLVLQRSTYEVLGATLDQVEEVGGPSPDRTGPGMDRPQILERLRLTDEGAKKVTVAGEFIVQDASGVGSLQLPSIRSAGCEVSRRWVAVTVDPRLNCEQATRGRAELLVANEFAGAWIGQFELPTMAYRLEDAGASLDLKTHPKPSHSSAQWQMIVGYRLNETRCRFQAMIDTSEGYLFQHRLAVPAGLEIDEVTATVSDAPREIRWTRPTPEEVVVFYDSPVSGTDSIQLRGHIPAKGARIEPLPRIVLQGVKSNAGTIDVYRQYEVVVELESVEGLTEHGPPVGVDLDETLGRIVSRWVVDGLAPASAMARIESNDPKVVVRRQVASLRQVAGTWTAEIDCRLEVEDGKGIVDRVSLETSEIWPGPYLVTPGIPMETDEEQRELVLRPPVRDEFEFQISGPVAPKKGGGLSVPRIRLKNVKYTEETERLVILPAGPAPELRWQVLGLTPADLPSRFVAKFPGISWIAYRVQKDDYSATIRPDPDEAQVHFADIRLGWSADGECRGVAVYDLDAGDRESCVLRLPPSWRLMGVSNHGVPISPHPKEDGTWTVPLGRTGLPQRLELVYAGKIAPDDHGQASFEISPRLEDMPVSRAVWTVSGAGSYAVVGAAEEVAKERVAMERLRNVTAIVHGVNQKRASSREEDAAWYRGWLGEWVNARHEAELAVALSPRATSVRADQAALAEFDRAQQAFVEQLGVTEFWERLGSLPASRVGPGAMWDHTEFGAAPRYYFSSDGASAAVLQVEFAAKRPGKPFAASPVLYVSAVLFGLLTAWAIGALHRWPHSCGVVLGLCWWLWFWPSVVGLLLIGVSLYCAIRSGWRRSHSSGSVIARAGIAGRL